MAIIARSSEQTEALSAFTLSHDGGETQFKLDCSKPFNSQVDHFSLFWLGRPNHECLSAFINQTRQDMKAPVGALFFFDHSRHRIRPRVVIEKMPSALEQATIAQYGESIGESLRFVRYELYPLDSGSDNPRDSRCAVWADIWAAGISNVSTQNTEVGLYTTVPDLAGLMKTATHELIEQTLSLSSQLITDYLNEILSTLRQGVQ
jgi:hypothetical protein